MPIREEQLKKYDLIEIHRLTFRHWCMYVGNGEVVHFVAGGKYASSASTIKGYWETVSTLCRRPAGGDELYRGEVKIERLEAVIADCVNVRVNNLTSVVHKRWLQALPDEEIERNIIEAMKSHKNYHLFHENCEHFVTAMKYGYGFSSQVSKRCSSLANYGYRTAVVFFIFMAILTFYGSLFNLEARIDNVNDTFLKVFDEMGKIKEKLKLLNLSFD